MLLKGTSNPIGLKLPLKQLFYSLLLTLPPIGQRALISIFWISVQTIRVQRGLVKKEMDFVPSFTYTKAPKVQFRKAFFSYD